MRRFLYLVTKKCRIYAACGVSQTPIEVLYKKEEDCMTKFVGAEYFVANMLIEEKGKGKNYVSFEKLGKCGIYVQEKFIEANMDVIFLTSKPQFMETIYDFSDYFECVMDERGQAKGIALKKSKSIDDLQYRFVYYLPIGISNFLQQTIQSFAA